MTKAEAEKEMIKEQSAKRRALRVRDLFWFCCVVTFRVSNRPAPFFSR